MKRIEGMWQLCDVVTKDHILFINSYVASRIIWNGSVEVNMRNKIVRQKNFAVANLRPLTSLINVERPSLHEKHENMKFHHDNAKNLKATFLKM
jgi:hypothetical protein